MIPLFDVPYAELCGVSGVGWFHECVLACMQEVEESNGCTVSNGMQLWVIGGVVGLAQELGYTGWYG